MKRYLKNSFVIFFLALILVSCDNVGISKTLPTPKFISVSHTPTPILLSATATETPYPTTPAQATIESFESLCAGAREILGAEISPNGKWIAALCYWENGKEESPLQVVNIDNSKGWKIYYCDYGKAGLTGDRRDGILPYRWSKDGKFLYTVAESRLSGCCWIGGKYVLLVRLNLETGEQTEIINGTDFGSDWPFSFTISENDRFLLFTPLSYKPYDFSVLDFQSGKTQVIRLEYPNLIDLQFAIMSPYEEIIILPLFKTIEIAYDDYSYVVESLALINLRSKEQRILISELKDDEELYPINWIDKEHILISSAYLGAPHYNYEPPVKYWSLNIYTGERIEVEKP